MAKGKILVAYVTKGGAAGEAALEIAKALREKHDFETDVADLRKNRKLAISQYSGIVVGSGVRIQHVYRRAIKFLSQDFGEKKIAVYITSCEAGDPKSREIGIQKYITCQIGKAMKSKPFASEAFGGRMKFGKTSVDNLDMEKVRAWAEKIGAEF